MKELSSLPLNLTLVVMRNSCLACNIPISLIRSLIQKRAYLSNAKFSIPRRVVYISNDMSCRHATDYIPATSNTSNTLPGPARKQQPPSELLGVLYAARSYPQAMAYIPCISITRWCHISQISKQPINILLSLSHPAPAHLGCDEEVFPLEPAWGKPLMENLSYYILILVQGCSVQVTVATLQGCI